MMTKLCRTIRYDIADGVRDLLAKEIGEHVSSTTLDSDDNGTILAGIGAHALHRYLPGEILHALQVFTASGSHALTLANLPTQDFPVTPVHGYGQEHQLAIINSVHLGLIRLLDCTPFAVDFENDGRLIRNVVPNPNASGRTSSWGSDAEFFWHSDNPNLPFGRPGADPRPFTPRYLAFYAVRNEEQVPTELMAVEDAVPLLDDETRKGLSAPDFEIAAPDSNEGTTVPLKSTPILDHDEYGRYRVRFDRGATSSHTAEGTVALNRWVETLPLAPADGLVLNTGEFMIFDNHRVLHRRRAFTPRPEATARWLRRCYAS